MRTSIELSGELEARLKKLAARRGVTDYAALIEEALVIALPELEGRFQNEREREEAMKRTLSALGSFTPEEAEALRKRIHEYRKFG